MTTTLTAPATLPLRPAPAPARTLFGRAARVAPLVALIAAWTLLAGSAGAALGVLAMPVSIGGWVALVASAAVIGLAGLAGLRQLALLVAAAFHRPRLAGLSRNVEARVALLYPTANDFRPDTVRASMRQSHPETRTVILDDASDPGVRARVDAFAAETGAEVARRVTRTGFKAGNLNAWLDGHGGEIDYAVVLDADQEIGPRFVTDALARFAAHPDAAIVQGRIGTRKGATRFVRDFGSLFARHADMQLAGREALGIAVFAGRGAMLDVAAVRAAGGFPEVVAEDAALSIELTRRGRRIVGAPELISVEDAPIDHAAFSVQFGKFSQGAMQLLGRSRGALVDPRLTIRRRLDLALDLVAPIVAATVPLALFAFTVVAAGTGASVFPWQLGLALAALGAVPLLPETARRLRECGILGAVSFTVRASLLYSSVAMVAARSVAAVLASGRARFVVTPKDPAGSGGIAVLSRRSFELTAATAAVGVAATFTGEATAALPFVVIAAAGVAFGWRDARVRRG